MTIIRDNKPPISQAFITSITDSANNPISKNSATNDSKPTIKGYVDFKLEKDARVEVTASYTKDGKKRVDMLGRAKVNNSLLWNLSLSEGFPDGFNLKQKISAKVIDYAGNSTAPDSKEILVSNIPQARAIITHINNAKIKNNHSPSINSTKPLITGKLTRKLAEGEKVEIWGKYKSWVKRSFSKDKLLGYAKVDKKNWTFEPKGELQQDRRGKHNIDHIITTRVINSQGKHSESNKINFTLDTRAPELYVSNVEREIKFGYAEESYLEYLKSISGVTEPGAVFVKVDTDVKYPKFITTSNINSANGSIKKIFTADYFGDSFDIRKVLFIAAMPAKKSAGNIALELKPGIIKDEAGNISEAFKISIPFDTVSKPSLDNTSASIKEDATSGTSILDLADSNSGKDLDAGGNPLTYAIKSGNSSGLFSINPATGLITLAPGKSLDFESKSSYKLNVSASNSSNKTDSATVTINVTDVADHSPSIADQSVSIKEDAEPGTTILDLDDSSGNDTDADGEALTYSITSGNADNLFSINANTGLISLASGQSLDYESKTQHILTVTASDGTNSDSTDITINVSDVADQSPSIADRTLSVLSSLSPGTSILDLDDASGNDTDADGQNLTYSITSGNSAGTFSLNSSTGVLSLATGQALTGTTYPLTITASDGTNSDSADITINVAQTADQSPSISNKLIYVEESVTAGTTLVDFADASGGDTDADGQDLTYSITSGNSAGTFSINPSSGILTIASGQSLDYESTTAYTLEVAASDGVNSDVATVNINVVDVADAAPSVGNYAVYAEESITPGTTLIDLADSSGGDTDADGEALTYSIKSGNSSGLFSLDSASGIISLASGKFLDYETNSSYNLVINATDGSSTDSSRVAVNVMDVAESFAPTTNSIHVDTTGQPDHITGTISASGQTSWAAVPLDADRDVQFGFSGSGSLDRSNITIKAIYNDFGHQVTAPNSNFVTFAAPYASTFYLLLEGSAAGSYNLGVSGDGTPHTGTP